MTYSAMATKYLGKNKYEVPYESPVAPTVLCNEEAKNQTVGEYQIYQGVKKYDTAKGTA
ncbi:MAG: hypothetical protein GY726_07245 [Proteobacteria bacterium]|nr:hypothetical protein [Pseudomonadota bacterium]